MSLDSFLIQLAFSTQQRKIKYLREVILGLIMSSAFQEQEAARSLQWFRGPQADVGKELLTIRNNVLAAHSDRYRNPNRHALSTILNPILITCGLMLFQRFSGANAFNFYAVSIFRQTFGGMDPHSGAVAVAFVQLLSSLLSGKCCIFQGFISCLTCLLPEALQTQNYRTLCSNLRSAGNLTWRTTNCKKASQDAGMPAYIYN